MRKTVAAVPYSLISSGVLIHADEAPYFYVEYRPAAPVIVGNVYEPTLVYKAKSQVYYNGYFYSATQDALVDQSPESHPDIWELIPIPKRWELALIELVYAKMLRYYASMNKSEWAEHYRAEGFARQIMDRLVDEEQGQMGQLERVAVESR
jgi:hypothetical protein